MSEFTFTEKKILDSSIQPSQPSSIFYTTKTETKSGQRQVTTLTTPGSNAKVRHDLLGGIINWKDLTFEIGGVRKKKKELKRRVGGWFSRYELLLGAPSQSCPAENH
jgi:hypothetical protein